MTAHRHKNSLGKWVTVTDGAHSHPADAALTERVKKLEAQMVTILAQPVRVPTVSVPCGSLAARIAATPSGGVLNLTGCSFSGSTGVTISSPLTILGGTFTYSGTGSAIVVTGTDVTISGMTLDGTALGTNDFQYGIEAELAHRLHVVGCTIHHFVYAGVGLWTVDNPVIEQNFIHHIGPGEATENNAYGIFNSSYNGTQVGSGGYEQDNIIEDITTWQGINVHAASDLIIRRNTVRRVRRAFWVATGSNPRVNNVSVLNNRAEQPTTSIGGDMQPYFVSSTDNCTFDGNSMSSDWAAASTADGGEFVAHIRDYLNDSTGLVRTNTTVA